MLIVGLGNPGAEYEWTRHNLGFMLVDLVAKRAGREIKRSECRALVGRAEIGGSVVELVKPQTYMNLSGVAVSCLLSKRVELETAKDLVVICDDIALPFGTIRLRARGSSAGQKGLQSVITALGTDEFMRLRIGIKPDHPVDARISYVLERFPKGQRDAVQEVLDKGADALHAVVTDGIDKAMAQYN